MVVFFSLTNKVPYINSINLILFMLFCNLSDI